MTDRDVFFRLGVLFTPLLPAVQILKLLLLFYIKKVPNRVISCIYSLKKSSIFETVDGFPSCTLRQCHTNTVHVVFIV